MLANHVIPILPSRGIIYDQSGFTALETTDNFGRNYVNFSQSRICEKIVKITRDFWAITTTHPGHPRPHLMINV
jgi:hypothetical protein